MLGIPKGTNRNPANKVFFYKAHPTQAVESEYVMKALAGSSEPAIIEIESGFQVKDRTDDAHLNGGQ